jgi:phosphoglycolate phosphatase-like HAD superfamily hydrolase
MIRLVLFDIDGTLVHTGGAGTTAFTKTFARISTCTTARKR